MLGWFLVGVAFRTIIDGSIWLIVFTAPIALLLLAALAVELTSGADRANVTYGLAAGAAAIIAIFVLRALAPNLSPICPPTQPGVKFNYPGNVGFWDDAQSKYDLACLSRPAIFTQ